MAPRIPIHWRRHGLPLVGVGLLGLSSGCSGDDSPTGSDAAAETTSDSGLGSSDVAGDTASESGGEEMPLVELKTSAGNLVLELRPDLAPATVANFIAYADAGFYDGSDGLGATIIHRVIPGFVIQGGGLTEQLASKSTMPPIASEAGAMPNERGTVAMALIPGDTASATSQFFINVTDNPELDDHPAFTVFATVALGMDLVDTMSGVATTTADPYDDVPVEAIVIEAVNVL